MAEHLFCLLRTDFYTRYIYNYAEQRKNNYDIILMHI